MDFEIVPADPADADSLTELAFESKGHWGYPAHWLEQWRDQIAVTPALVERYRIHKAAALDNTIVGCFGLAGEGSTLVLEGFWVRPSVMGRGIGRALYRRAMEVARQLNAKAVEWESDPNAEPFYARMGAERIGTKTYDFEGARRSLPVMRQTL